MLKIKCVKKFGTPENTVTVSGVSLLIVEDDFNNPLLVVMQIKDNPAGYTIVQATDPNFNNIISGLGIDKIVINQPITLSVPAFSDKPIF